MIVNLTKKNYLGVGYIHTFKNADGVVNVPCTKEEYDALALPNAVNPTLEGYEWAGSSGGTIMVDNPDTLLKENEYCDYNGRYFLMIKNPSGNLVGKFVDLNKITNDSINYDEIIWQYQ